ncbi:acyl-CoA dehydrogenase family protein [Longirhabdus pacifica]|uniref:acyl-CoA dehydrogenase family protein n=1 Tax=Longirhabdus pacifica TaxID=2305227 RepID=UPI0010092656|nr:acyl-CoA dehydrogenase family protein [Longirhabdus pacifica]
MNFSFTNEQIAFRKQVSSFFQSEEIREEVKRIRQHKELDATSIYRMLGEKKWLAVNWSEHYGGQGKTLTEAAILSEEMSKAGVPEALHVISIQIVGMLLYMVANEEQKERYLIPMAAGEKYAAVLYTEPHAGSDLSSLKTEAKRMEDGSYNIYGTKVYSMKTHLADYAITAARTTHAQSKYDGLTLFMVPLKKDGVYIKPIDSMADESFFEVKLDGVNVSDADRIGELDKGWAIINQALAIERTGLDYYIRALRWFHMVESQMTNTADVSAKVELKKLKSKLQSSRLLMYKILDQFERTGNVDESLAAMSKMYASELACEVVWKGFELRGTGASLCQDHGYPAHLGSLESAYRETPGLTISAGSTEMMLETVAKLAFA